MSSANPIQTIPAAAPEIGKKASNYPPGPSPIGSNIIAQLRFARSFQGNLFGSLEHMFAEYGDFVHLQVGNDYHAFMSCSPDIFHEVTVKHAASFYKGRDYKDTQRGLARFLGNGLVTSDGEFWKRQRKLVQPAFHTRRIEAYARAMVDYTLRMLETWQDGAPVDVADAMMRLTLSIVTRSLFDTESTADAGRVGEVMAIFQRMSNEVDFLPNWIPTLKHLRERCALRDMDSIIYHFIDERRAESLEDRGDLLSMLLLAADEEGGMTDQQVRDEAVTLFLAGHETTANALNWTWYLLAQHPEVETKLDDEIDSVLEGKPPTLADLHRLPYAEMVIKEAMRIFPPVWGFGRQAIEDVEIGGYTVPKGGEMNLTTIFMHRSPHYWEDPERFWPERFAPENADKINKYAYQPFGNGPRICIGNSFAMMEAHLLLATIAGRFRLRLSPGQIVEPEPLITLRPKNGLPMRIEAR